MPNISNVKVDVPLSNLAIAYKVQGFIGDAILPPIGVARESDKFYKFQREELKSLEARRAIGSEANEIQWDVTNGQYSAEEYALKFLLPDRIVANSDSVIQPRINTVNKLTYMLLLAKEKRIQALVQSTTHITQNGGVATKWDAAGADPEKDIDAAAEVVQLNSGVEPNVIVMNSSVARVVKRFLRGRATLSIEEETRFAKLPDIIWDRRVIVANSIENTAAEGATASLARVWNDNVLVAYVEPTPSLQAFSLGYQFVAQPMVAKSWREEKRDGEMIEVGHIQDEKIVATEAAYLITDVLT